MTKERFELELMRIKSQVGPEHVGYRHTFMDGDGNHCIMGQMLRNLGMSHAKFKAGGLLYSKDPLIKDLYYSGETGSDCSTGKSGLADQCANFNNKGWTWHAIIDHMIPAELQAAYASKLTEALEPVEV